MRIYVPLQDPDIATLSADPGTTVARMRLDEGRAAWAATAEAREDRAGEDLEDLEYEALQDAVHAALERGARPAQGAERVGVLAGDVSDGALEDASADGGAFGVRMGRAEDLRIASIHVTELGAATIRADDTDPALLWFDAAEAATAIDYLRSPSA